MTREEAMESLRGILTEATEFSNSVCYVTEEDREPLEMAIKALEQESCEDAVSRQAVLDKKELIELEDGQSFYCISPEDVETLPSVNPQPCEDAIGRSDMLDAIGHGTTYTSEELQRIIMGLPPVNPQPKTGLWIYDEEYSDWYYINYKCSCCKRVITVPYEMRNEVYKDYPYCHCGAKMIDPQESEEV